MYEGLTPKEIAEKLFQHYGPNAYKYPTVKEWIRHFRLGKNTYENDPRSGRPKFNDIELKILKILDEDPFVSARSMARTLGVSDFTIRDRLHNSLGLKCLHLKLVPHYLTIQQKKSTFGVFKKDVNHY